MQYGQFLRTVKQEEMPEVADSEVKASKDAVSAANVSNN
jgi:hypothetical protein